MYINEVESIVRLSKKSIRYYEEQGLINPERNSNNDYRIYNDNDIKKLKIIKFLRDLGVSINDLKKLNNNDIELTTCIKERIKKIEDEENKYLEIKEMCQNIIDSNKTYNDIDITEYSKKMNVLNKEGFTMKKIENNQMKNIMGSIYSSLIAITFLITLIFFTLGIKSELHIIAFILIIVLFILPIMGIIINLISRIKEINGGEENEASKY